MASSKIKGINIKISADTRGLDTALKGIENKSKSAKNELFEINKSIKSTPDNITLWRQKQEVLTKAIADSREKVKLLEDAQDNVAKQLKDGKINGETYRAFQRELENARSESKRLESQLSDTNKNINELGNGMKDAAKDAEKASGEYTVFKDVLGNLVTQGINFAIEKVKAFTTEIIETGKAFEASMSNVGAISGATSQELDKLSEKAKQMGASTKYTASQAADAFSYMALAGWKTEDMLVGIDGVLNLAASSNMDLAKASDIVTDYLTAFGLTAQDSAKFVDQMSFAMSNSNTTTELLGEAYKNCAATASSMGYSVEETTAVLMTMANAGVKGGEAGTALNAIMTRLATDTKKCASELKGYGVHVYDTQGNMQSLSSILQGVSGVWSTLTDQQQANLAKIIAGTNHYSALQTIMNGLGDAAKESGMSFTDYASALEECDGTAQNMANTMIDNLAGDMTILDSSIDGVKIALSEKLNPIIRDLVQYITEKMPEIQKSSEKALDTGIAIAEWCKKHMPEIKETAKDLIPYIIGIGSGFAGWNVATKVTSVINKLFGVVKSGSVYMKLLNAVMSANPAVAVTTAIVGLTGAIVAWNLVQEDEISIADKVNEKYKEQTEKIQDIQEKINDLNNSFYDSANAIDDETQKAKDLWKELHNLGGESGEVHEANRKRAEYIMKELNEALGTEYTMTGNQINNYQNLSKEIDKVIQKKHAEALLDAAFAQSAEMAEQKKKAESAYLESSEKVGETRIARNNAWNEFSKSISGTGNTNMTAEEIVAAFEDNHSTVVVTEEQYNAAKAYIEAKKSNEKANEIMKADEEAYYQAVERENNVKKAHEAVLSGNYDIERILNPEPKLSVDQNATKNEKLKVYNEHLEKLKRLANLKINSNNQSEVNGLIQTLNEVLNEGQAELGLSPDELIGVDIRNIMNGLIENGYDLSEFTAFGKDSGIGIDKFFGPNYSKILSEQIQNKKGYNVDDFLEWASTSETKISKDAWDDVASYIWKQIEKYEKYDITPILKTAKKAGVDIGEAFGGDYMKIVQSQIDEGFNPTELIKWFSETDEEALKSFKENYKDIAQSMIDAGYDPTYILLKFAETDEQFSKDFKENGIDVIQSMLDKGFNFASILEGFGLTADEMFNVYDKNFHKKVQALFDKDFSTSFFKWSNDAGISWEELMGENLPQYMTQYEWQQGVKSGKYQIQSAEEAKLYKENNPDYKKYPLLGKNAVGGYISSGNKGIVAEAGPELLEVMNGGVRITPLKGNSRNTAVSDNTAGQKIFYNTYNINNPRISNDMDIRQISQKLAIEQRRIEKGRGL